MFVFQIVFKQGKSIFLKETTNTILYFFNHFYLQTLHNAVFMDIACYPCWDLCPKQQQDSSLKVNNHCTQNNHDIKE